MPDTPKADQVRALREARFDRRIKSKVKVTVPKLRQQIEAVKRGRPKGAEPWKTAGVSRRTWYRQKGKQDAQ